MEPGTILNHLHIPTIKIELIDTTAKGWKVNQTETQGRKKPKTTRQFYSDREIKDLFKK